MRQGVRENRVWVGVYLIFFIYIRFLIACTVVFGTHISPTLASVVFINLAVICLSIDLFAFKECVPKMQATLLNSVLVLIGIYTLIL